MGRKSGGGTWRAGSYRCSERARQKEVFVGEERRSRESMGVAFLMVAITLVLMAAVAVRLIDIHFIIGPWFAHHWLTWIGTLFIGVYTPVFYMLKRRRRDIYDALLRVHVFGGLLAVALVALHFTQHVTRPAAFYPDLGTGVVLFSAVALSAFTGLLMRYRILTGGTREWRLLHTGAAVTFYLAIGMHIATGLGWA
jgi:hypothetical protein